MTGRLVRSSGRRAGGVNDRVGLSETTIGGGSPGDMTTPARPGGFTRLVVACV